MSENNDVVYQIKENYIWLMYELESILGKTTNHDIYKMCYMFRYLLINGFLTKHDINFDSTDESFTEGYYVFSKHNNYVCALNMLKDILDICFSRSTIVDGICKSTSVECERKILLVKYNKKYMYYDIITGELYGLFKDGIGYNMDLGATFITRNLSDGIKGYISEYYFNLDEDYIDLD